MDSGRDLEKVIFSNNLNLISNQRQTISNITMPAKCAIKVSDSIAHRAAIDPD